ncbi:hypothetical protein FGRMN_10913 [Fusarium graminum]|nr:hypothetical protein FGRMN_10913 [Fusarium graminum]
MDFEDLSMKEILFGSIEEAIGAEHLQTVKPSDVANMQEHPQVPTITEAPICITQRPIPPTLQAALSKGGLHDVVIGLEDEVPRREPGSVVKWSTWRQGFSSQEDAQYAAQQLTFAAQAWNDADVGVPLEYVPEAKDATFVLVHGGEDGKRLASAFFPNKKDLDYMYVYSYTFSTEWRSSMWTVFTHELGHVLGLRHEFAISDAYDEGPGGIQITAPDELSVMNYRKAPPKIQQSDILSLRKLYSMTADASGQPPKIGMTNVVDYIPR